MDGDQPIVRALTMPDLVARSEARRTFALVVLETFALLALVLAGIGLYGVLAGSVAERTREIGVRAALGASRGNLVRMVVRQGLTLAGLGAALGVGAAAVASRMVEAMLFGVSRLDPATYLMVLGVLAVVAAVACWVPAAHAAAVDPMRALRNE